MCTRFSFVNLSIVDLNSGINGTLSRKSFPPAISCRILPCFLLEVSVFRFYIKVFDPFGIDFCVR